MAKREDQQQSRCLRALNKNDFEWALQHLCIWGLAAIVHLAQHCTRASALSATAVGWLQRLMLIKREIVLAIA